MKTKISFIFLVVCVVASFALPERNRSVKSELGEQGGQQQELENNNQGTVAVDDELIGSRDGSVDPKTISPNQTPADIIKHNNWIARRHEQRHWLRNGEGRRGRNNSKLSNGESRLREQDGQQQDIETSNEETSVVNDELIDANVDAKTVSPNEIAAVTGNRYSWIARRHEQRHWLRNGEERRGRNNAELNTGERRLREQNGQQQDIETTDEETAVVNDDANVDAKTISPNEIAAETGNRYSWIARRHERRHWLRNGEERRGRNNAKLNNGERRLREQDIIETAVVDYTKIGSRDGSVDEKPISPNDTDAETDKRNNWVGRRHNRLQWLRNGGERRGRNTTELNNDERVLPSTYNSLWYELHARLPYNDRFDAESHQHHHHRHHHHHHKNRTTTTTTTSTTPTPLSEIDKIAMYRPLIPN